MSQSPSQTSYPNISARSSDDGHSSSSRAPSIYHTPEPPASNRAESTSQSMGLPGAIYAVLDGARLPTRDGDPNRGQVLKAIDISTGDIKGAWNNPSVGLTSSEADEALCHPTIFEQTRSKIERLRSIRDVHPTLNGKPPQMYNEPALVQHWREKALKNQRDSQSILTERELDIANQIGAARHAFFARRGREPEMHQSESTYQQSIYINDFSSVIPSLYDLVSVAADDSAEMEKLETKFEFLFKRSDSYTAQSLFAILDPFFISEELSPLTKVPRKILLSSKPSTNPSHKRTHAVSEESPEEDMSEEAIAMRTYESNVRVASIFNAMIELTEEGERIGGYVWPNIAGAGWPAPDAELTDEVAKRLTESLKQEASRIREKHTTP